MPPWLPRPGESEEKRYGCCFLISSFFYFYQWYPSVSCPTYRPIIVLNLVMDWHHACLSGFTLGQPWVDPAIVVSQPWQWKPSALGNACGLKPACCLPVRARSEWSAGSWPSVIRQGFYLLLHYIQVWPDVRAAGAQISAYITPGLSDSYKHMDSPPVFLPASYTNLCSPAAL